MSSIRIPLRCFGAGLLAVLLAACASVQGNKTALQASASQSATDAFSSDIKAPATLRNGGAGLVVPDVNASMLHAGYWIDRDPASLRVEHSAADVQGLNEASFAASPVLYDLTRLRGPLSATTVRDWIAALAGSYKAGWIDAAGTPFDEVAFAGLSRVTNVDTVRDQTDLQWGVVTARADLRRLPTALRIYSKPEDVETNIDRFQESALLPGSAVVVLHQSLDGQWLFVNASNYRAWIQADKVRRVSRDAALASETALYPAPLPYSRANVLKSAFRYLGEPYGWGHADGTRDCSGFVSEVYVRLGVRMPRNTGDQRDLKSFHATRFDASSSAGSRSRAVAAMVPGDLVYVPGHVMMVIGKVGDKTYVIHDTPALKFADGRRVPVYGVTVSRLDGLMFDEDETMVQRMQAVVRPFP